MTTFRLLACACLGLIFSAGHLCGQTTNATLTGSWQLTFGPSSLTVSALGAIGGLATFTSDLTVVETDTSEVAPSPTSNANATSGTPGHGIWQPGPAVGTFYIQFVSLAANRSGGLQSRRTVTITGMLDASGNQFHGNYNSQVTDPAGHVITSSAGVLTGQRMQHPLLP